MLIMCVHADNGCRWTYYVLDFLETQVTSANSKLTLGDLFDSYDESKIHSQPGVRWDLFPGGEEEGRLRTLVDFFGNVQNVEVENANATEPGSLQEDLIEIARLVEKWRSHDREYLAAHADGSQNSTDVPLSDAESQTQKPHSYDTANKVGPAKMTDVAIWEKRLIGTSVLGACAAIWFAGSKLGRSSA